MSEATLSIEGAERARFSEDWLAVAIGIGVFALALLSLAGVDALGWIAATSVWNDPTAALAPVSKAFAGLSGGASHHLSHAARRPVGRRLCARRGRPAIRHRLHRRFRYRLCELVYRQLGAPRRGHAS
jgi:hypothetical protein